ncbi:hypothetical protein WJX72_000460 [[Myrmecia] bisecta]|uniref:Uncharacterized protein n=1 Tax=[Myrmecia] bisecta TaxID=41462 RepID=A0AAW1QE08_9CHLO
MLPEEDLVEGAKKVVSKTLSLGELELAKCPVLTHLHGLEQLDLQRNEMVCIPQATLPLSIRKLTLTGNLLEELPGDLVGLTHLEELYAGANRLTSLKPLLQCRPLLHAGLCYNCIDTLPSLVTLQQLVSLDLSHNKLCNLVEVVERLKLLPELRNLCLKGNPFCLGPAYWPTAKPGAGVEAPAPPLPQGSCSAVWTLPINAQVRDWIRDGIRLSLIRTTTSAGPEWSAQATQATAGAGSRQEVVAEGVFRALAVLDGVTRQVAQPVRFLALPDLWDERKLRLPLDDQRHAHRQVAMLQASLRVHPGE